jgi:outer membrane protein assembly factor BamB
VHDAHRCPRVDLCDGGVSAGAADLCDPRAGSKGDLTLKAGQESSEAIAWSKMRGGVYLPSPIALGDHLYTVSNNGILTAYEAKTGTRVYQQRVGDGGSFVASPVAAAGKLYIANEDGDVYVVKAGAQYELLAKNAVGEAILATPAFAGDMLIVRGEKHLYGIKAK